MKFRLRSAKNLKPGIPEYEIRRQKEIEDVFLNSQMGFVKDVDKFMLFMHKLQIT